MLQRMVSVLLLVVGLVLVGMAMPAGAESMDAGPPDANIVDRTESDPVGASFGVVADARKGNWKMALAGVLSLVVFALKRFGDLKLFETVRGGAALTLCLGLVGWFALILASGASLSAGAILSGLGIALNAIGGYHLIKRLIFGRA